MRTPIDLDETLSLADLCRACGDDATHAIALIEEGVIVARVEQEFPLATLKRLRTALRLHRELQLNAAGAALAVDLLEEIERLRTRVALLESALGVDANP